MSASSTKDDHGYPAAVVSEDLFLNLPRIEPKKDANPTIMKTLIHLPKLIACLGIYLQQYAFQLNYLLNSKGIIHCYILHL
jgi:hypothetical protein